MTVRLRRSPMRWSAISRQSSTSGRRCVSARNASRVCGRCPPKISLPWPKRSTRAPLAKLPRSWTSCVIRVSGQADVGGRRPTRWRPPRPLRHRAPSSLRPELLGGLQPMFQMPASRPSFTLPDQVAPHPDRIFGNSQDSSSRPLEPPLIAEPGNALCLACGASALFTQHHQGNGASVVLRYLVEQAPDQCRPHRYVRVVQQALQLVEFLGVIGVCHALSPRVAIVRSGHGTARCSAGKSTRPCSPPGPKRRGSGFSRRRRPGPARSVSRSGMPPNRRCGTTCLPKHDPNSLPRRPSDSAHSGRKRLRKNSARARRQPGRRCATALVRIKRGQIDYSGAGRTHSLEGGDRILYPAGGHEEGVPLPE